MDKCNDSEVEKNTLENKAEIKRLKRKEKKAKQSILDDMDELRDLNLKYIQDVQKCAFPYRKVAKDDYGLSNYEVHFF